MKSCKTNLVICFRKLDDSLCSIDISPTDEDTRTPDLPLDRQIRIGTGIQYDWNKDVTVGAAYEYLDAGEAETDQDGGPL
jgi:long-chain fatty acid transport protein